MGMRWQGDEDRGGGEDRDRCSGVGGWGLCWLDARFEGLVSMACLLVFLSQKLLCGRARSDGLNA